MGSEMCIRDRNRHIQIDRGDYYELACGINEWCLLSKMSNLEFLNLLVTFLFVAVLVSGLTYMHAGSRLGAKIDSKRFRKNSGNLQDTSKIDCGFRVDASLATSATLSLWRLE